MNSSEFLDICYKHKGIVLGEDGRTLVFRPNKRWEGVELTVSLLETIVNELKARNESKD